MIYIGAYKKLSATEIELWVSATAPETGTEGTAITITVTAEGVKANPQLAHAAINYIRSNGGWIKYDIDPTLITWPTTALTEVEVEAIRWVLHNSESIEEWSSAAWALEWFTSPDVDARAGRKELILKGLMHVDPLSWLALVNQ